MWYNIFFMSQQSIEAGTPRSLVSETFRAVDLRAQRIINNQFQRADASEIVGVFEDLVLQTREDLGEDRCFYDVITATLQKLPQRLPKKVYKDVLSQAADPDMGKRIAAQQAFIYLSLRTITSVVEPYSHSIAPQIELDELMQIGVEAVTQRVNDIMATQNPIQNVHSTVSRAISIFVKQQSGLSEEIVLTDRIHPNEVDKRDPDNPTAIALKQKVREAKETLTIREAHILDFLYGLGWGRCLTYEEVGREFGITSERVVQIEKKVLRRLRHPGKGLEIFTRKHV